MRVPPHRSDELDAFQAALLDSLPRSDQRRHGRLYIEGLLATEGRKTIRKIALSIADDAAVQRLHHFIRHSTWDWMPVRRVLAAQVDGAIRPAAWVARPMVVPKSGRASIGVARRFIAPLSRELNCQLAFGLWLASEAAAVPVDWNLVLDGAVTHREHVVGSVERMAEWGLERRPVVLDAREFDVRPVVAALSARAIPFLVQVSDLVPLVAGPGRRPVPAAHLVRSYGSARSPVFWSDPMSSGRRTSLVATARVSVPDATVRDGPLTLLTEWEHRQRTKQEFWLTDLTDHPVEDLVGLTKLTRRVARDFLKVGTRVGLSDYEGRHLRGWHHHMTLASAAHAVATLFMERHGARVRVPELDERPAPACRETPA